MSQTIRSDQQLSRAVTEELRWTPSVDSTHIRVVVEGGTARLSGEVGTYPETLLAAKAAMRVRGILAVSGDIAVRGPWAAPDDKQITRYAADALDREANIPDTVVPTVHHRALTLSGEVTWEWERDAAARAVQYVPGVTTVLNALTIHRRPMAGHHAAHHHVGAAQRAE